MILTVDIAKQLAPLNNDNIEAAITALLDYIEHIEKPVINDPDVSNEKLRVYQGKMLLISELRQYRERILDALELY